MNIKPNRTGLLLVKKKLKLAGKGYKLLKDKQDTLISEFFKTLKEVKELRKTISGNINNAISSMEYAQGQIGVHNLTDFTKNLKKEFTYEVSMKNVMGVKCPQFTNVDMSDEWISHLDSSISLDSSIKRFRTVFPSFVQLVSKQIALKKIADEIRRTKRKVNSLDNIIIPQLRKTKKKIDFKLQEQERENFTRLKKIKQLASIES